MKRYEGSFACLTDRGRVRLTNEDQATALTNERGDVLLVVCDGMGGNKKGGYASKTAIESIVDSFSRRSRVLFPARFLNAAIKKANRAIFLEGDDDPSYQGMGTTLVAALITKNKLVVANVGDSRCYSYSRAQGLKRLTRDQTYVDYLVRTGKVDKEKTAAHPDRHVLMNALGIYPTASMDIDILDYHGESLLLCSDGLYNNLSDPEIRAILQTDDRPDQKARSLIIDANNNGGSDNIGVAYWEAFHD